MHELDAIRASFFVCSREPLFLRGPEAFSPLTFLKLACIKNAGSYYFATHISDVGLRQEQGVFLTWQERPWGLLAVSLLLLCFSNFLSFVSDAMGTSSNARACVRGGVLV